MDAVIHCLGQEHGVAAAQCFYHKHGPPDVKHCIGS
jgi:hypothetical protein